MEQNGQCVLTGFCGENITWRLEENSLYIQGNGEIRCRSWSSYKKRINKVFIEEGVTSIGAYAFYGYENLTDITIPDSVISIGKNAFYHCKSLTGITLPDSITSIGEFAFAGCKNCLGFQFRAE